MWINRLKGKFDAPEERARAPDLWLVRTKSGCFFVSCETAREIARQVRSVWPRSWIRFYDLSGSEIHIRRGEIVQVIEGTVAQRANDRLLLRLLDAESEEEADDE